MTKISQREARRLRKRVRELEAKFEGQISKYSLEWPSYTVIGRITPSEKILAVVQTARALKHAVVAVPQNNEIALFASNLAAEDVR